jgi:hypothetical protein
VKIYRPWTYLPVFLVLSTLFYSCKNENFNKSDGYERHAVGELSTGATVYVQQQIDDRWGILVENAGLSSLIQPEPVQIELYKDTANIVREASGYESINTTANGFTGKASVKINDVVFNVTDT